MSNPGDGSGATGIVPALPSSTRVADIFAFQADGTVQAITSDGTTAWTADASQAVKTPTPDFLGGLVFTEQQNGSSSIVRLDGITGQRHPQGPAGATLAGVHPDGTIFATLDTQGNGRPSAVIGIDPTTGAQKFSVPFDIPAGNIRGPVFDGSFIVAGDGYAYTTYLYGDGSSSEIDHLQLLRVNSSGAHDTIKLADYPIACCPDVISYHAHMITNAGTGILLTWDGNMDPNATASAMAITNGTTASVVSAPALPGYSKIAPVLQAQDGSFIGSVEITPDQGSVQDYMIAFDAGGNLRWAVPDDQPQIATADGGVIGESGITYDQNGNAMGQIATPAYSWFGNSYQLGSVDQISSRLLDIADSYWAFAQGNASGSGAANRPLTKTVQQPVAQIATSYTNPPQNATWVGNGVSCNLFVKKVLEDAGQKVPYSTNWIRRAAGYFGLLHSPVYYPALAGNWANRSTTLGCWHNVTFQGPLRLAPDPLPADLSKPGDIIAEAINYADATGHVGIVVGAQQTASADSAAFCMSAGQIPAEIIDITDYGFRPDGTKKVNANGVVCSTVGWKTNAVVKRFACQ